MPETRQPRLIDGAEDLAVQPGALNERVMGFLTNRQMHHFRRIAIDYLRRKRLQLAFLGALYLLLCGAALAIGSDVSWRKLTWTLAYFLAPYLGTFPYWYDGVRGWRRSAHLLPLDSDSAATISWCVCVGIPTLGLLLLSLPAAAFSSTNAHSFWAPIIVPTVSVSFASASFVYFVCMLVPTNLSPNLSKRSVPRASVMLIGLVIWVFGASLVIRWAESGRWGADLILFVLCGLVFSWAGFGRARSAASGTMSASSVLRPRGLTTANSGRHASTERLTGWAQLTAQCLVRQAGLAFGAVLVYLLYEAARVYFFDGTREFQYGTQQRSLLPSVLLASLVFLGYMATLDGFFSPRLLRTLPLSPVRCGLQFIGLACGSVLFLITLSGGAFFLMGNEDYSIGLFLNLLGAAGPASLSFPWALYIRNKTIDVISLVFLVLAPTVAWTHVASLLKLSALVFVAPAVFVGGNLVSLMFVIRILSRSSRVYGGQLRSVQ